MDLPRPLAINAAYAKDEKEIANLEKEEDIAAELVKVEMISVSSKFYSASFFFFSLPYVLLIFKLLTLDSIEYPTKSIKPPSKVDPDYFLQNFEHFDARELAEAQALVDEETKNIVATQGM